MEFVKKSDNLVDLVAIMSPAALGLYTTPSSNYSNYYSSKYVKHVTASGIMQQTVAIKIPKRLTRIGILVIRMVTIITITIIDSWADSFSRVWGRPYWLNILVGQFLPSSSFLRIIRLARPLLCHSMGVSDNMGVPHFGVLIIRILLSPTI